MRCPKCHVLLNFIREEVGDVDLDYGKFHTTTEYICLKCQRTFLTSSYYGLKFIEEKFIDGDK